MLNFFIYVGALGGWLFFILAVFVFVEYCRNTDFGDFLKGSGK